MTKRLIGALVGALLIFIWQFLSWSVLNLHSSKIGYADNQDAIMEVLSENLSEGSYFIPNVPPGTSQEEHQKMYEESIGKPWAMIEYHSSLRSSMGMNMFRGFIVDFVAVFLLIWLLGHFAELNFKTALLSSIAVGVIGYLTINYIDSIWFENNSIPDLIDAVVAWGLCGAWLGWWLNR